MSFVFTWKLLCLQLAACNTHMNKPFTMYKFHILYSSMETGIRIHQVVYFICTNVERTMYIVSSIDCRDDDYQLPTRASIQMKIKINSLRISSFLSLLLKSKIYPIHVQCTVYEVHLYIFVSVLLQNLKKTGRFLPSWAFKRIPVPFQTISIHFCMIWCKGYRTDLFFYLRCHAMH